MFRATVKVLVVGELVEVPQESGKSPLMERDLIVEVGCDQFVVTVSRDAAEMDYHVGDFAIMTLSFKLVECEGRFFQDITAHSVSLMPQELNL